MINRERLLTELQAAPLPVVGVAVENAVRPTASPATWHSRPEGQVRVDWPESPSPAQESQAGSIVTAHDGNPTEVEKLDEASQRQRVMAAVILRASSQFAGLSAARRNRIQALIDNAAADIIALLS